MRRLKETGLFLLLSLVTCMFVFQDAMWGNSIAAPIDIAPALWKHYKHVDPNQGPIPKNHYIVDQLSYDLPLQYLMYHAWRSGEVPWWNPYSMGGRPLLADAHCNGTDPVRLAVYFTVPDFVLAYNWTLILHCIGTGIGFYLMLRAFGIRPWVAGACALAAQWAGGFVLYIGHPWVRASFLYYPWLWIAWHRAFQSGRYSIAASLLVGAIFYSGNLQSHTYLPVFASAVGAGYAGLSRQKWKSFFKALFPSAVFGTLIAAPVLLPQLELYAQNTRRIEGLSEWHWLDAGVLFTGIHPWAAGTFRTISLGGVNGGLSFHLAVGGAVVILAAYGWSKRKQLESARAQCGASGLLVLAYFLIVLTPLHYLLYLRAAGLGIMGLIVLAAFGSEAFLRSETPERRWSRSTWALAAAIALGTTALAYGIYPHFEEKVRAMLLARSETDGYGGASRELRNFQASNFVREVSLRNPECTLNVGAIALLATSFAKLRPRRFILIGAAMATSLAQLLLFAERFICRSKTETWSTFLEGGPVQKAAVSRMPPTARLQDPAATPYSRVFPQEISALHRLHVSHGYAALEPAKPSSPSTFGIGNGLRHPARGDYEGAERFRWINRSGRTVRIVDENLTRIRIVCAAGPADTLVRTDTRYDGWCFETPVHPSNATISSTEISLDALQTEIGWAYHPSRFGFALTLAFLGLIGMSVFAWRSNMPRAKMSQF